MKYRFQVCLDKGTDKERWADVRPAGGAPYEYATRDEAERMAYICYGNDHTIARVVELDTGEEDSRAYDWTTG